MICPNRKEWQEDSSDEYGSKTIYHRCEVKKKELMLMGNEFAPEISEVATRYTTQIENFLVLSRTFSTPMGCPYSLELLMMEPK
jgi:hypothetical protein